MYGIVEKIAVFGSLQIGFEEGDMY